MFQLIYSELQLSTFFLELSSLNKKFTTFIHQPYSICRNRTMTFELIVQITCNVFPKKIPVKFAIFESCLFCQLCTRGS